jgi:hypothetical protein
MYDRLMRYLAYLYPPMDGQSEWSGGRCEGVRRRPLPDATPTTGGHRGSAQPQSHNAEMSPQV